MRRFTAEEDQFLRDNYLTLDLVQMGKALNRSHTSIHGRLARLGIPIPAEITLKRLQQSFKRLQDSGSTHQYQKGMIPHNKGQKMSAEQYEKSKATMFKPGQLPANTVYFGKPYLHTRIRKDGYVERIWFIQEGASKRSAYLAYLCRQDGIDLTGKKPILKPGFDHSRAPIMEDIMIITNAENMRRNTVHRYPKEVVRLCQLKGALQRQINKHQENE